MTTSDKRLSNTISSMANLLNNIFSDYKNNIIENNNLAEDIDDRVALLDKGFSIEPDTALINKAMETTKSDPQIDIDDPLREIGEFIVRKSLLPTKHKRLDATMWKLFGGEFLGSRRRHAHERDRHLRRESEQILSSHVFISSGVTFPQVKETKKHKRKILSRKKK